jgi:hypothetical protein
MARGPRCGGGPFALARSLGMLLDPGAPGRAAARPDTTMEPHQRNRNKWGEPARRSKGGIERRAGGPYLPGSGAGAVWEMKRPAARPVLTECHREGCPSPPIVRKWLLGALP